MDTVEGLRDAARQARECAVMGDAVTLARWIGTSRRPVTPGRVLRKADVSDHVARGWLAGREPVQAAREILAAAEDMSPLRRSVAVRLVEALGDDALPAWREMASAQGVAGWLPAGDLAAGSAAGHRDPG